VYGLLKNLTKTTQQQITNSDHPTCKQETLELSIKTLGNLSKFSEKWTWILCCISETHCFF